MTGPADARAPAGAGPCGGIDLGGTKIEARLFDGARAHGVDARRIPTPTGDFDAMIAALAAQVAWLRERAGRADLRVGVALPGAIDPDTGGVFAANIPTGGRSVAAALTELTGSAHPVVNDAMAFALSEATFGAGADARVVMGLILGTGIGGGICIDGALPHRHAGLSVELGHTGLPARGLNRHGLPALPCGCGRAGCLETYVSGTGLANLAERLTGTRLRPEDLPTHPEGERILSAWADLAGEALDTVQLTLDPDCIVLGGGLSNMLGIEARLAAALASRTLTPGRLPAIRVARHGDTSGARGAALMARAPC